QPAVLPDPAQEPPEALVEADAGRPAQQAGRLADVGHEDALVAGPPGGEGRVQGAAQGPLQPPDPLPAAHRAVRAAAQVQDLAADVVDPPERRLVGVDQVADPEGVADLLAVAVDGHRRAGGRGHAEPGDPALVLDPELAGPIDARLSEYDGLQSVDASIVADV